MKIRVGANLPPDLVVYTSSVRPVKWSPQGDWIAYTDPGGLHAVSPDGRQQRPLSSRDWQTFGWSADGKSLYGIASTEDRRLTVGRVELATGNETQIADLGPVPAAMGLGNFHGELAYRGFSLSPDGKSFLTSLFRAKADIWLLAEWNRPRRLWDALWTR